MYAISDDVIFDDVGDLAVNITGAIWRGGLS